METTNMAENIVELLTDVADAIREKKGSQDKINAQRFAEEIRSIESGGGEQPYIEEKDVNFYDYDGTLLFAYTLAEAQALTELPTPKGHEGLIFQHWNYTLEDVKVGGTRKMDIGALYITDDGSTRLYIEMTNNLRTDVPLYFKQDKSNGVIIDWGDGSPTETIEATGAIKAVHHYAQSGKYVISLFASENTSLGLGSATPAYCSIFGVRDTNSDGVYSSILRKVELGHRTRIEDYAFINNPIETISVCNELSYIGGACMSSTYLKAFIFSRNLIISRSSSLASNVIRVVSISPIVRNQNYALLSNARVGRLVISQGMASLGQCYRPATDLLEAYFPKSIKELYNATINGGYATKLIDFSFLESIPTMASATAFTNLPDDCRIVVPDALYDEWIVAPNWTTWANLIVKVSEYYG